MPMNSTHDGTRFFSSLLVTGKAGVQFYSADGLAEIVGVDAARVPAVIKEQYDAFRRWCGEQFSMAAMADGFTTEEINRAALAGELDLKCKRKPTAKNKGGIAAVIEAQKQGDMQRAAHAREKQEAVERHATFMQRLAKMVGGVARGKRVELPKFNQPGDMAGFGRVDIEKYAAGTQRMENFFPMPGNPSLRVFKVHPDNVPPEVRALFEQMKRDMRGGHDEDDGGVEA